jgi:hypothetical protein
VYRIRCFCLPPDWISSRPETDSKLMSPPPKTNTQDQPHQQICE